MTLETREFIVRSVNAEDRVVSGIAVPWDTPANVGGYTEVIRRGAVEPVGNVKLLWRHDEPIGVVTAHQDTDAGFEITAKISQTARGDEAYTLLRDGVIDKFSIGFQPVEHEVSADGLTVTRSKIRVHEVSLVPIPAYEGATVSQVREAPTVKEDSMSDVVTQADLTEVRESFEALEREVKLATAAPVVEVEETRTAGEILKAIARGDEATTRAYAGATTANAVVKNGWVGDLTRIVDEASPLVSLFSTGNLPAEGNHIEFARLKSNTVDVDVQAAEGDDLTYGEIEQETATAPVKTLGGYSQLTRQAIERSTVNILDATLRAQAIAVGKAINVQVRSAYATAHAAQVTATNTVEVPATATYGDWLNAVVDAAVKFDALGLSLDALVVDKATFKALTLLEGADGRPVFLVSGAGVNNVGTLDVKGLKGDLASVQVILDAGLAAGKNAFVNRAALRAYKSPVVRLQDENIVNLSKDFSVYTYLAVADEIPAAIVPVVESA